MNKHEFAGLHIGLLLAFLAPPVDLLEVEPPITADFEGGQLPCLEQPINGAWMYVQVLGKLSHGQYLGRVGQITFHGFACSFDAWFSRRIR